MPSPTRSAVRGRARPRFLILGAHGQLGGEFLRVLGPRACDLDRARLDLADAAALERVLVPLAPRVVINAAAFNHVDAAETLRQQALAVNALAPAGLARLAARQHWRLVHFSTDYVFGGDGLRRPRLETDPPAPVNFYGYSKLLGEQAVLAACPAALVLRVAHLYGGHALSPGRGSLVERFLARARAGEPITAIRGQSLNPTSVRDVVAATLLLLERGQRGLFHLTGEGQCSVQAFARQTLRLAGLPAAVRQLRPAARDSRRAPRPPYTVLENRRWRALGLPPLPRWQEALAAAIGGGAKVP